MDRKSALVHDAADSVGVVVQDVSPNDEVQAVSLEGTSLVSVQASDTIPLGHKIAVREIAAGEHVLKYGRSIGRCSSAITVGAHVHTHNVRSERWK